MYSLDELRTQNQEIADLCDVLSVLVEHKSLRGNPFVCELVTRFREKVWMHLVFEDNTVYSELLRHPDEGVSDIARQFHESARPIKRQFSHYLKHWCNPAVDETSHAAFVEETREIFSLIMERVEYENEQMFPLVEAHQRHES